MDSRSPHSCLPSLRRLLAGAGFAALLCAAAAHPAWAERASVRLGAHAGYTRVVVDFDRLVGYAVDIDSGRVTLTLDTPADLALPATQAGIVSRLAAEKTGGKTATLSFTVPDGAALKHYRLMRKIVLDVYPPAPQPARPASAPAEKTPPAAVPQAPAQAAISRKPEATPPADHPAAAPAEAPDIALPPPPSLTALPAAAPAPSASGLPDIAGLPAEIILDDDLAGAAAETPAIENARTTLRFSSVAPQQLAVFTRGDHLWIVTEGSTGSAQTPEAQGPLARLMGSPQISRFDGGTAYRYRLPAQTFIAVDKKNLVWEVRLSPLPLQAPGREVVHVEFDRTSGKARLLAALKGSGRLLTLQDPDAGDTLHVVAVSEPAARIDQGRRFADAEVIPAYAGMVVRPLSDSLRVTRIKDYVLVSTAAGLNATPDAGPALLAAGAGARLTAEYPRLFDFANWRQGGLQYLTRNRSQLERQAAAAPNDDIRNEALMNMALLYFANNFGQETLGILRLLAQRNPALTRNPDFIALRGAAAAMAGHYQDALQDLSHPAIQQHPEVNLWIGYAAAASEQWRMANRTFPADNSLLVEYPPGVATPFTIYMAESALRLGRTDTAIRFLDTIDTWSRSTENHHRAAIAYLRGEAARQEGRKAEAMRIWRPVANGIDRLYHAKASLALANLELAEGAISPGEAINLIDSLRFAWRGDGLEVQILHNLGQLKVQNGRYLEGLGDMRRAMTLADSLLGDTDIIRADMSRAISDIFVGGQARNIAPLEAIAIHSAYGSLLPTGAEGSLATLNFADFLIQADLLEKAAELIDGQLRSGAAPAEKTPALGAKLAAVYLLDGRPSEALAALQRSQRSAAPETLAQERQMLYARALSQLNRTDDAITALAELGTEEARRLRADVLWRARRWIPAAQAIEALLPEDTPATLGEDAANMVVNAAVAYKLGGNSDGLGTLRSRFGSAIAATPQANAFGVITRDGGRSTLGDRETILKIAGEVDMFKGFLKGYQARSAEGG
jgi:hypothetical protein